MVLIDMPMPNSCLDCPFFKKHSDCGQCKGTKKGKWIEPEDYDERQVWCPMKEQSLVDTVPVASIEDEIRFLMTLGNPFATNMSMQLSGMLNRWKEREGNG